MTAPRYELAQMHIQNPHASAPLILSYVIVCNTSDEDLSRNVRANSALDLQWLKVSEAHDVPAVLIGGGPSVADHVNDIRALQDKGAVIFAMNGASKWARGQGIAVDYQVMSDAKPETASLVDPSARAHLFASQVNPVTMKMVGKPILWHLETGEVEKEFSKERRKRGGYVLIGGGATTGNCATCIVYAMGHRELHVFGYDSSHKGRDSHVYRQPMNDRIPVVDVEWAGKKYTCSVAMKAQAEKFQITAQALKQEGCQITVYGDGLLQQMYNTPPRRITERDKYRALWQFDGYREVAPGEFAVPLIEQLFDKPGPVIDFGCGTGRAGLKLAQAGYDVILVDFADNCRDDEALNIPFLEWDLSHPCPLRAPSGICCDVMEHIPTDDVDKIIRNIMQSSGKVFFQISTVPDTKGEIIHQKLHLTVRSHEWWRRRFINKNGYAVEWQLREDIQSSFLVCNPNQG